MTEEYHRSMVFSIHRFIMRLPHVILHAQEKQDDTNNPYDKQNLAFIHCKYLPTINTFLLLSLNIRLISSPIC